MKILVAAAHFVPSPGDVNRNMRFMKHLCLEASMAGAKLLVLPELSLTGRPASKIEAAEVCQLRDGSGVTQMIEVATDRDMMIAFGYVEVAYGNLYNSVALVGPRGLLANVRKRNLSGSEFQWANEGQRQTSVAVTGIGRIGILPGDDISNKLNESHPNASPNLFYPKGSVDIICAPISDLRPNLPAPEWVYLAESLRADVVISNSVQNSCSACVIDRERNLRTSQSGDSPCVVGGHVLL